jgi:hypothetical protein
VASEDTYDLLQLIEDMPASQAELARQSKLNERSIIRIKNGASVQRSTANKVLHGLSQIYNKTFTLKNVTGINISSKGVKDEEADTEE